MINITRNFLIYSFVFSFIISVEAAEGPTVEDIQSIEAMRLGEDVVLDAGREFREIQTSTTKPKPGRKTRQSNPRGEKTPKLQKRTEGSEVTCLLTPPASQ